MMRLRSVVALGGLLIGVAACANLDQSSPVAPRASQIEKPAKPEFAIVNLDAGTFTWEQASAATATLVLKKQTGWKLAWIHNADENAAAAKLLRSRGCWIGGVYVYANDTWTWENTAQAWDYSNFFSPQGDPTGDSHASLGPDGTWLWNTTGMGLGCYVVRRS